MLKGRRALAPRSRCCGTCETAPVDAAITDEEVAAASLCAPDRGSDADCSVTVVADCPARTCLLKQIQVDDIAASARTQQGGSPDMGFFARDVERGGLKPFGKLLDALVTEARSA